jgi:hypothetical protein
MTTNYVMTDGLSKDSGGQKIMMWIDDTTSQLDFGLPRGIGSETLGATSKVMLHQAIGTHTVGSAIGNDVGVILLGAYTEAPSAIGTGNAQFLRSDKEGSLYSRPASGILSVSSASVETHVSGSLLLHDLHINFNNVDSGDSVEIEDGNDHKMTFTATAASQHFSEHYSAGLVFNTSIKHTITIAGAGAASVTLAYGRF